MSVQVTPSNTLRTKFDPCRPGFTDRVYKVAAGVEIPVRIWPARKAAEGAGWLLWIHGGGFQSGNPYAIAPMIHPAFGDTYHIISLSYRYLPQVGLQEEIEDCVDGFQWCRQNLASILPGIDIDKYFVGGDSAGGTLSTLMGHHLSPAPRAVLNVYGVVDFIEPKFYKPFPAALDLTGRDDLRKRLEVAIKDRDPANAAHARPARFHLSLPIETLRSFWGKEDLQVDKEAALFDCDLYDYVTAMGKRMSLSLREEECTSQEEFTRRAKGLSPLWMLDDKESKGKDAYPPCFILHGTGDSLVPVEQSYRFEKKLKDLGVAVEARYFDGEPHGFDQRINGPESAEWPTVVQPIIDFVQVHVA